MNEVVAFCTVWNECEPDIVTVDTDPSSTTTTSTTTTTTTTTMVTTVALGMYAESVS